MLVRLLLFCSGIILTAGREFKNSAKFTDFIHEAIQILSTYDDTDLEYFFDIFNNEVRKYHYKGCKFHELIDNADLKKFLGHRLESISQIPAADIRSFLSALSQKFRLKSYKKNEKELVDLVNSLYKDDAVNSFRKVLNNMEQYKSPKSRKDLGGLMNIVGGALKSTLFDHYTELNRNARIALKTKLDEVWNDFVADTTSKLLRSFFDGSAFNILTGLNNISENNTNIGRDNKEMENIDEKPKVRKPDLIKHFEFEFSSKGKKLKPVSTHSVERKRTKEKEIVPTTEEGDVIYREIVTDAQTNATEHTSQEFLRVNSLFAEFRVTRPEIQFRASRSETHRERSHKHKSHNSKKSHNVLTTARVTPHFRGTTHDTKRALNKEPSAEHQLPDDGISIELHPPEEKERTNKASTPHVVVANFF